MWDVLAGLTTPTGLQMARRGGALPRAGPSWANQAKHGQRPAAVHHGFSYGLQHGINVVSCIYLLTFAFVYDYRVVMLTFTCFLVL